ncbi:14209_t:CDS:2, partial [Ambispora leptoticha]
PAEDVDEVKDLELEPKKKQSNYAGRFTKETIIERTQSLIDSYDKMFDATYHNDVSCSWQYGEWKSLTATIFGAQNVRIGHSTKSETDKITIHNIKGGFYIDTPGFDDSDEDKNDEETVFSISLKILETKIQNITTILWSWYPTLERKPRTNVKQDL